MDNFNKNLDSINPNTQPRIDVTSSPPKQLQLNLMTARQKPPRKRILKKIFISLLLIIVFLGGVILARTAELSQKIFVGEKTTFFAKIVDFIRGGGDNARLIGEDLNQINILLLGVGGEGHEGPYLTDTMILAQIRPDIGEVSLTTIPRDYLIHLPEGGGFEKINASFPLGLTKTKDELDWDRGGRWARESVEEISGLKVPYFAVVDFSGFEKAMDQIGGLDVYVERGFTDSTYPNKTFGYLPSISFEPGQQHFNGERALQFARSRHGDNNENSDFARSQRQQKIIEAFKTKVLSLNIIKDVGTLNKLLDIFADHFHTNLNLSQLFRLHSLVKEKDIKVLSSSLDPETNLICPLILASNGAYVLTPCPGKSEGDVKNFFKNSFAIGKLSAEKSVVWLANSTSNTAAYDTAFRKLTSAGLQVYQLGYTKDNLPTSIVYQVNSKPATVEFMVNELKATEVTLAPPEVSISKDKVDIIVVLGTNAPVEPAPKPYIRPPARIPTTTPSTASSTQATSTKPSTATSTKKSAK